MLENLILFIMCFPYRDLKYVLNFDFEATALSTKPLLSKDKCKAFLLTHCRVKINEKYFGVVLKTDLTLITFVKQRFLEI